MMIQPKKILLIVTILFVSSLSSYAVQRYLDYQQADALKLTPPESELAVLRPEFAMTDLNGEIRNINEWDGQIILLNFWATWCPPCLSEIPGFMELQTQYGEQGFQVIGIAVDDEEAVRQYVSESKMNYPVIAAEFEALELSSRYGNRMGAVPYSVIINRNGEISDRITGELHKNEAEALLKKLGLKS
jgi:thiol-disulfide isomerase/thioredoxin